MMTTILLRILWKEQIVLCFLTVCMLALVCLHRLNYAILLVPFCLHYYIGRHACIGASIISEKRTETLNKIYVGLSTWLLELEICFALSWCFRAYPFALCARDPAMNSWGNKEVGKGKFQNGKEFCYRDSRNSTTWGDKQKWDREKNSRVKWDFFRNGQGKLKRIWEG